MLDLLSRYGLTAALIFSLFLLACSAPMAAAPDSVGAGDIPAVSAKKEKGNDPGRYIVSLVDPPLAAYSGGIQGLEPTNPEITGKRLDMKAPATRAYLAYLAEKQTQFKKSAERVLKREVVFERQFDVTINAVVMTMTPAEASRIASLPEVYRIERDRESKLHLEKSGGELDRSSD